MTELLHIAIDPRGEDMNEARTRAVIADDHPLVVVGLQKAFAQAGIEVVGTASDASALMELLRHTSCDVVVTDYSMPRGGVFDGWRLLASLSSEFPSLPVVVYSEFTDPFLVGSVMQSGVRGVISKRDEMPEISKAVFELAKGKHYCSPAMKRALDKFHARPESNRFAALSCREMVVTGLMLCGLSTTEMARHLKCTSATVGAHWLKARKQLGFDGAFEMFRFAAQHGLWLDAPDDACRVEAKLFQ
jgi:two-component system, NarL family, captular synthesis response regulator RcsB